MGAPDLALTFDGERLTWQQVCERYPAQWVVLVDMDWVDSTDSEFRTAVVAGVGPNPDDPFEQADRLGLRFPDQAHLFTGTRPRHPMFA